MFQLELAPPTANRAEGSVTCSLSTVITERLSSEKVGGLDFISFVLDTLIV